MNLRPKKEDEPDVNLTPLIDRFADGVYRGRGEREEYR
jgi:hypothetical protein